MNYSVYFFNEIFKTIQKCLLRLLILPQYILKIIQMLIDMQDLIKGYNDELLEWKGEFIDKFGDSP